MFKNISLILLFALLLVSCATRMPEVEMASQVQSEPVVEEVSGIKATEPSCWPTPAVTSLTAEQWDALFNKQVEEVPEFVENPVGTTAISVTEPVQVEEQPEPSAEVLADMPEEKFVVEQEKEIVLPEMEYEFTGEDYRSLSWVLEKEDFSIAEVSSIEAITFADNTVPEENVSADEITALAVEYKELEKIDFAKPTFKARMVTFLKEHILFLELGVLAILAAVIAMIFIKRSRKVCAQAQEAPVIDEGEEIVLTPRYYVNPNATLERPNATPENSETDLENSREEESESEFKAEHKTKYEAKYGFEYSYKESNHELEDESGYDSMDDSVYEEDPGG